MEPEGSLRARRRSNRTLGEPAAAHGDVTRRKGQSVQTSAVTERPKLPDFAAPVHGFALASFRFPIRAGAQGSDPLDRNQSRYPTLLTTRRHHRISSPSEAIGGNRVMTAACGRSTVRCSCSEGGSRSEAFEIVRFGCEQENEHEHDGWSPEKMIHKTNKRMSCLIRLPCFGFEIESDYRLIAKPKVKPGITSSWSFKFGF
jgi:hypothetical protein